MMRTTARPSRWSTLSALCLAVALLVPRAALATDYTDNWFIPAEAGWGANFVQSDNFIFVSLFVYGADKKPTWYTAQLTWDGTSKFAGGLYVTQGTYFALPWNTGDSVPAQSVGTASFTPSTVNAYSGVLSYTVTVGVPSPVTVTKPVQRLTLTTIALGGDYIGGQTGAYSACLSSGDNGSYTDTYKLNVTQTPAGVATFLFTYDGGATCTMSGTLQQHGFLYDITGASYVCTGGLTYSTTARMYEIKATSLGIEGRLQAPIPGAGCAEDAVFSAVLK
jgi:hypothetical protein